MDVFVGQIVSVDLSAYDGIIVVYKILNTRCDVVFSRFIPVGGCEALEFTGFADDNFGYRYVSPVQGVGIIFEEGRNHSWAWDNQYAVPLYIYGAKGYGIADKWNWLVTPYANMGLLTDFYYTKDNAGRNAQTCAYSQSNNFGASGSGWLFQAPAQSNSEQYFVSTSSFDLTNCSQLVTRVAFKGYGAANKIGLISSSNLPSSSSKADKNGSYFAVWSRLTTTNNSLAQWDISIDVSSLTGTYNLAAYTAGSSGGNYYGNCLINWARAR